MNFLTKLGKLVWGAPLLFLILGAGILLTVLLRGIQLRRAPSSLSAMFRGGGGEGALSPCLLYTSYAFANTSNLVDLTIGSGTMEIGDNAFYKSAVESIAIGDSVSSIGRLAFYSCNNLTSVTLPAQLSTLTGNLFYNLSLIHI